MLVQISGTTALSGIAKQAAAGVPLFQKRQVSYRTLPTRKWLNRCHSKRVPFQWTINPYRGCEYGCQYCYARFTHEFLELREPKAFETEIYAKDWDPLAFQRELAAVRPGHVIGIGTATDPYQPAERRFERTRRLLEALLGVRQVTIFLTTKSDLVARDVDLLRSLSRHNELRVTMTVTTLDADLARMTEPFAPRPDLRLEAAGELVAAAVPTGVIASPVLPLLTDSREQLRAVAKAAKAAGADSFGAGVLFLKPSAQKVFLAFVAERFPQHLARYEKNYRAGVFLRGPYPDWIARLVEEIRSDFQFAQRNLADRYASTSRDVQLRLF